MFTRPVPSPNNLTCPYYQTVRPIFKVFENISRIARHFRKSYASGAMDLSNCYVHLSSLFVSEKFARPPPIIFAASVSKRNVRRRSIFASGWRMFTNVRSMHTSLWTILRWPGKRFEFDRGAFDELMSFGLGLFPQPNNLRKRVTPDYSATLIPFCTIEITILWIVSWSKMFAVWLSNTFFNVSSHYGQSHILSIFDHLLSKRAYQPPDCELWALVNL